MAQDITKRVLDEAQYIIDNKATLRTTADNFGISKSTVCRDMGEVLPRLDWNKYIAVHIIVSTNLEEKSSRGGISTTNKKYGGI